MWTAEWFCGLSDNWTNSSFAVATIDLQSNGSFVACFGQLSAFQPTTNIKLGLAKPNSTRKRDHQKRWLGVTTHEVCARSWALDGESDPNEDVRGRAVYSIMWLGARMDTFVGSKQQLLESVHVNRRLGVVAGCHGAGGVAFVLLDEDVILVPETLLSPADDSNLSRVAKVRSSNGTEHFLRSHESAAAFRLDMQSPSDYAATATWSSSASSSSSSCADDPKQTRAVSSKTDTSSSSSSSCADEPKQPQAAASSTENSSSSSSHVKEPTATKSRITLFPSQIRALFGECTSAADLSRVLSLLDSLFVTAAQTSAT